MAVGVAVGGGVATVRVAVVVSTTTPSRVQNAVALVGALALVADTVIVRLLTGPVVAQLLDQTTEMRLLPPTIELTSGHLSGLLVTTALPTLLAPEIWKQTSFTVTV